MPSSGLSRASAIVVFDWGVSNFWTELQVAKATTPRPQTLQRGEAVQPWPSVSAQLARNGGIYYPAGHSQEDAIAALTLAIDFLLPPPPRTRTARPHHHPVSKGFQGQRRDPFKHRISPRIWGGSRSAGRNTHPKGSLSAIINPSWRGALSLFTDGINRRFGALRHARPRRHVVGWRSTCSPRS